MYAPGDTIGGKYRVLDVLGQGGVGITYRAEPLGGGRELAVKVLELRGAGSWKTVELFEREALVLARLEHEGIPRYIDHLQIEGPKGIQFCLVQERAPGRTLTEAVKHGFRVDEGKARDFAMQLLDVLVYLQSLPMPVVHRDIKPDNVVCDETGKLRVVDFGSVREIYHNTVLAGTTSVGTLGYMAPEQLRGQALLPTDLYGVAATIVFALTGASPADLPQQRLRPDLSKLQLSPAFRRWLQRALEPAPEDRFSSAAEALAELRDPKPVRASVTLGKSRIIAAAIILSSVGVGAALLFVPRPRAEQELPVAPRASDVEASPAALGEEHLWRTRIGITTYRSTIHLRGDRVIVNSNGERRVGPADAKDGIYILDAKTGRELRHILPAGSGEKDANGIAFTDEALYFGTDQERIFKYSLDGELLAQMSVDGHVEAAPAVGDVDGDGRDEVVFGTETGTLFVYDGDLSSVEYRLSDTEGGYGQRGFMGAAALFDANGDGAAEIFMPGRGQKFRAIDAKRKRVLWHVDAEAGLHSSPIIVDVDDDGRAEVAFADSYGTVFLADAATGEMRWKQYPAGPNGMMWTFAPMGWYPDAGCIVASSAPPWAGSDGESLYCLDGKTGETRWRYQVARGNISSGAVVGDVGDDHLYQELVFGTEFGEVVALSPDGQQVWQHNVGYPIECTPTLGDVDDDGRTDVLVADNGGTGGSIRAIPTEGRLHTHGRADRSAIPYFRGDEQNRGVLLTRSAE